MAKFTDSTGIYIKEVYVNKEEVTNELECWKKQFSEVLSLFDNPIEGLSTQTNLKVVSERYTELKNQVFEYDKKLEKAQKYGSLSEFEESILLPAIREVALHCSARKGSISEKELSSSLYDGENYLSYYLSQVDV